MSESKAGHDEGCEVRQPFATGGGCATLATGGGCAALRAVAAVLILAAPIAYVTWPLIISPGAYFIDGRFFRGNLWAADLIVRGVIEHGKIIMATTDFLYPLGGSLTVVAWLYNLGCFLLHFLGIGLLPAMNLLILLQLLLGGYFAYLLAMRLTGDWSASVVGGLAYGFSPFILSATMNGQVERLSHGLIPLLILLLLDVIASGRIIHIIVFGLVFALLAMTDPYNGIVAAMLLAMVGVYLLIFRGETALRKSALRLGWLALAAALATLPFLIYYYASTHLPSHIPLLHPNQIPGDPFNAATLFGWFAPAFDRSKLPLWLPIHHVHYLGWVGIALALASFIPARAGENRDCVARKVSAGFFLLAGTIFFILSLGWSLQLDRTGASAPGIHLPLYWFNRAIPALRYFAAPYRLAVGVTLCLSVLVSLGLARIGRGRRAITKSTLAFFAAVGLVSETLMISPLPLPLPVRRLQLPQVYRDLAAGGGRGAIMEFPSSWDVVMGNEEFKFYQAFHHRPVVLLHPLTLPNEYYAAVKQIVPGDIASARQLGFDENRAKIARGIFGEAGLTRLPFCYLVLHENALYEAQTRQAAIEFLDGAFDLIRDYPNDRIKLYRTRLPPPAGESDDSAGVRGTFYRDPRWAPDCS